MALLAILVVAAAFRFQALDLIPPGLHYDEAFHAVNAREIVRTGQLRVFYEGNYGVEPLFAILTAGAFRLLGESAWAARAVSALAGVVTVLVLYLLTRVMFTPPLPPVPPFPSPGRGGEGGQGGWGGVPLLAAFLLAVSYWHVTFSRVGIETNLVPLFEVLCFLFLWWGLRDERRWTGYAGFALSGVFLGLGLYTYPAFRVVPVLVVAFWGYMALTQRGWLRRFWPHLALLVAVSLLVFAPLGLYFLANPLSLTTRPGQIATMTPGDLVANVGRVAGMWLPFGAGDANPRSNLPGRPALDAFLAVGFFLGLTVCLRRWRRPTHALPVLWLGAMLLPTLLSEYAPHFRRAIGAVPAVALIAAIGFAFVVETIWTAAGQWRGRLRAGVRGGALAGLGLGLFLSTALAAGDYFLAWGPSPDLFFAYDEGLTHIARYAATVPFKDRTYLTPVDTAHPTLTFFLDGAQLTSFDGRRCQVLPPWDQEAVYIVVVHEDTLTLEWLPRIYPAGDVVWSLNDRTGAPYAVAFRAPAGTIPTHGLDVNQVGDVATLDGYGISAATSSREDLLVVPRPGETLDVTLYWRCRAQTEENYTAFVQLLGPVNPATGGPLWAQADQQPGGGTYPTSRWVTGETVLDHYTLTVPAGAPPGEYRLVAGMYLLSTMERLPAVEGSTGARYPDDAVPLTTVRVGEGQ